MAIVEILIGTIIGGLLVFLWLHKSRQILTIKNAKLSIKNESQQQQNSELQATINQQQDQLIILNQANTKLDTQLKERANTKAKMSDDFKKIANEVLKQDSLNLSEKNADLLAPLKTQIQDFRTKIEGLSTEQAKDRSTLKEQIKTLSDAHQTTLKGAEKLTNALTYDNKQQGNWGEMVLENILQNSGLTKNHEYELQKVYRNEDDKLLKPDVIVHLPGDKDIVIDSKVSLVAYQNYIANKDERQLAAHTKSIEKHIKDISLKNYQNLHNITTLDYIFVFFPIEASLLVALEQKPSLFDDAIKKNVALVSPSTLMMSLKIVHHIWQTEKQNKHTDEIMRLTANMVDKLYGFVESMDNLEGQLKRATQSYDEAKKRLNSGKGNVFSIADNIKKLGVNPTKRLKK